RPEHLTGTTETPLVDVGVSSDERRIDRGNIFGLEDPSRRHPRRKTKIQYLRVAVGPNHDVLGFQVAMDNARVMRRAKCLEHLPRNLETSLDGRRAPEPIPQG